MRRDGHDYRYLAHSSWNAGQPQYSRTWSPPAVLTDSLARNAGGETRLYDGPVGRVIAAEYPVLRPDGTAAAFTLVTLDADPILSDLSKDLMRIAWIPLVVLVGALAASLIAARRMTYGIEEVAAHAQLVARGSMRSELTFESGDEIGALAASFRTMSGGLRTLLRDVETGAAEVAATADELAAGAEQMSASTEEVAAAAQSIATSAAQQTKGIHIVVAISGRVAVRAQETSAHALRAQTAADAVTDSARRAGEAAEQGLKSMARISRRDQRDGARRGRAGREIAAHRPDHGYDRRDRAPDESARAQRRHRGCARRRARARLRRGGRRGAQAREGERTRARDHPSARRRDPAGEHRHVLAHR